MPRDAGVSRRPKRGGFEEEPGCGGYPTAMTQRSEGGAVGRGHPERAEPCDMNPDERGSEGCEAKGRGLDTKLYQAQ